MQSNDQTVHRIRAWCRANLARDLRVTPSNVILWELAHILDGLLLPGPTDPQRCRKCGATGGMWGEEKACANCGAERGE